MDEIDFYVENLDIFEFLNEKGLNVTKLIIDESSNKTWKEVIELISEYYDTQYEKYPDFDRDYID